MSIGLIFWVTMVIVFVLWLINWYGPQPWAAPVFPAVAFFLFFLLGWAEFGFVVHR